jgi:hypothetical protein
MPFFGFLALAAMSGLGGCGDRQADTDAVQTGVASASPAGMMSAPPPSVQGDAEGAPPEGVVVEQAQSLPGTPRPISCSAEYGASGAKFLVEQCLAVSPATRPPCNAANSCAMMRNEIARGCALLGDQVRTTPQCGIDPMSREAAGDTITRYYAAINAHDYAAAWQLWGDDGGGSEQTLDEFTKGFMQTRRTHVSLGRVSEIEGGAGSLYATVPVTVDAELESGRQQHFTGSYTVRRINKGMGPSQGWHIASATLRPS